MPLTILPNLENKSPRKEHRLAINAGAGNDYIKLYDDYIKLNAGTGNDTIIGASYQSSINLGAGNDRINLISDGTSEGTTIVGGTGNDRITLDTDSEYNLIKYSSGDSNDYIANFHSSDTLQIGGGTGSYSSQTSGKNIIVTVGEGKISLMGAASLSSVNIDGKEEAKNEWKLSGTTATYGTSNNNNIVFKIEDGRIIVDGATDGRYVEIVDAKGKTLKSTEDMR